MNDILDEETLAVYTAPEPENPVDERVSRLSSSNILKNQARYNIAQQKWHLFDNSILHSSSALLSLTVSIKRLQCPEDMYTFRQEIKNLLTDLKYKIAKLDYPPSIADKTCFLFAVMLDEQILHSDWGEQSGWENQTLVSELFGIKNGGEQFYLVTERALLQPVLLRDLLELIYIMIKLGFRGRYRAEGKELLGILIQRLEESVFVQKAGEHTGETKNRVQPAADYARNSRRPKKPVRWWRSVAFFLLLTGATWGASYYWYDVSSPEKARPFISLSDFTKQFYNRTHAQEKEYVYRSTPEEMETPASMVAQNSEPYTSWHVQLATFNTEKKAKEFISDHVTRFPSAQVETWKGQFRVVVEAESEVLAEEIKNSATRFGIDDAFVFKNKN